MHQVCNMKSGTAAAKLKACTSLDEQYPEPPRQLSSEKLEFLESKKKEKLSVIAEKKRIREIKQSDRLAVAEGNKENRQNKNGSATKSIKAGRGKYIKKCLPFGPGGELENSDNFESCNEFIRLVQDIKKFCIVKAQNIDPTFDYAASRKKRSTEMTKPGEEDLEEDILDDEMDNEVDEKVEDEETKINDEKAAYVHQHAAKFTKSKPSTQRKAAKHHLALCRSKDFATWFDVTKNSDKYAEEIAEQIVKAAEAKFEESQM